jgi:hypothetical protein
MAWETRGRGRYYYRRRKVDGRARRIYLGKGPAAQLAARMDAIQRQVQRARHATERQLRQRWAELDHSADDLSAVARLLTRAALQLAGFHQHARGTWRKRRYPEETPMPSRLKIDQLPPQEQVRLKQVFERARAGDQAVLPDLEKALARYPELWERFGDLGHQALEAWVRLAADKDLAYAEALRHHQQALREELSGPSPSPLERLLVDRLIACRLQVEHADYQAAHMQETSPALQRLAQRRQESAQRRLLAAVRELALVRRLLRPPPSPVEVALRTVPEEAPRRGSSARCREGLSLVGSN